MSVQKRDVMLGPDDDGRRLDRIARKILPDLALGSIFKALRQRDIRLNGKRVSAESRVRSGDTLQFRGPIAEQVVIRSSTNADGINPVSGQRIVYENEHIIVINKAPGQLAHGPDSLETQVEAYWARRDDGRSGVSFKPGPVHRLDRNTSGLIIYGLSTAGAQEASQALRDRMITKHYLARISGTLSKATIWESTLERDTVAKRTIASATGQSAITEVEPLWSDDRETLVMLTLVTGRTHQIRAQAAEEGHPLVGDRKYGDGRGRFVLHAVRLTSNGELPLLGFRELVGPLPPTSVEALDRQFGPEWRDAMAKPGLTGAV